MNIQPVNIQNMTPIPIPEDLVGEGKLYRHPMPFNKQEILRWKREYKITHIMQLCFDHEFQNCSKDGIRAIYREMNFTVLKFPIQDFKIPSSREETDRVLDQLIDILKDGNRVVIHCFGGNGRTGMIIACLARKLFGFSGDEALAWVRTKIPRAASRPIQENFVRDFLKETEHTALPSLTTLTGQIEFDDPTYLTSFDPPLSETREDDPYGWETPPTVQPKKSTPPDGRCCIIQ